MEGYLSILVKRLLPQAYEINAYINLDTGLVDGYARDEANELLPWPSQDDFEAAWLVLESELASIPAPAPEPTLADLLARIEALEAENVMLATRNQLQEDALIELLAGGV